MSKKKKRKKGLGLCVDSNKCVQMFPYRRRRIYDNRFNPISIPLGKRKEVDSKSYVK